ncbi:hypothetical protein LTR28_009963 [Elasticomyces elasticus]|nr:hypothetical protein LTR28_009963 [Elasticomyces elasticus]
MDDTSDADRGGSNRANKRKSESPHKARPAPALESDTELVIEVAVGRWARKPSQKVRDNQATQEELQGASQSEVLAVLQELNKRMMATGKEEAYRARANKLVRRWCDCAGQGRAGVAAYCARASGRHLVAVAGLA